MTAPCSDLCSAWATEDDLCSPCTSDFLDGLTDATIEDALLAASNVLFHLTGSRWPGSCQDTVRPCARYHIDGPSPMGAGGVGLGAARWATLNESCRCNPSDGCGCCGPSQIGLGNEPVTAIDAVKVDGVTLDAARYRVDDYRWLVRLDDADGTNPGWPCCQDMTAASTEEDTFEVTYTYGTAPPVDGKMAAANLACELLRGCAGETCDLPERVTAITRQGVSMVLLDPFDFLDNGKTGVYLADLFIKTMNPHGLRRASTVWSPDIGRRVRRAGT